MYAKIIPRGITSQNQSSDTPRAIPMMAVSACAITAKRKRYFVLMFLQ
jgi:hypothetical protein